MCCSFACSAYAIYDPVFVFSIHVCVCCCSVTSEKRRRLSRVIRVIQGEYKTRYLNKYYFKIVSVNKIHATALNAKSEC